MRVVVGRDQGSAGVSDDVRDDGFALGGCGAAEEDAGAVGLGGGDFGGGADAGHDDVGGDFEGGGGEGDGLGVVACFGISLAICSVSSPPNAEVKRETSDRIKRRTHHYYA